MQPYKLQKHWLAFKLWAPWLALIYGTLVRLRLWVWRRRKPFRAIPRVVSVGGLLVGGSGKTPFVDFLLQQCRLQQVDVACLTRGYGRKKGISRVNRIKMATWQGPPTPSIWGDEPTMLAQAHPTVPFYIGAKRSLSARMAQLWDAPHLLVLDDGFQHIQMERDLNLLLIDSPRGLGNGHLLPWGSLREPSTALKRADAIVLTKCNLGHVAQTMAQIKTKGLSSIPVFQAHYVPYALRPLQGQGHHALKQLQKAQVGVVCGVANASSVLQTIYTLGAKVAHFWRQADHHTYTEAQVMRLAKAIENNPECAFWLTTAKDAVKLQQWGQHLPENMLVLHMNVEVEPAFSRFFAQFLRNSSKKALQTT